MFIMHMAKTGGSGRGRLVTAAAAFGAFFLISCSSNVADTPKAKTYVGRLELREGKKCENTLDTAVLVEKEGNRGSLEQAQVAKGMAEELVGEAYSFFADVCAGKVEVKEDTKVCGKITVIEFETGKDGRGTATMLVSLDGEGTLRNVCKALEAVEERESGGEIVPEIQKAPLTKSL